MPIILQFWPGLTLFALGAAVFVLVAMRRLDWGVNLVLFSALLYLLKINVGCLSMTVLEFLILLLLSVWLFKKAGRGELINSLKNFRDREFWLPFVLIFAGALLATIFSYDIKTSAGIFKSWILEPMIFGLLIIDIINDEKQQKNALFSLVLSGAAVAAISSFYFLSGKLTFDGRLQAFFLSPNHLVMYLAPALLIALGFWLEIKKIWQKIFLVTIYCLLLAVLYFTYSYAAWLGISAALIFAVFMVWRLRLISNKKLFIVCCLFIFIFLTAIFSQLGGKKMANLLDSNRSSWQSRIMVWRAAGKILKDNWLLGIGPGMFQKYYLDYQKFFPVPYLEWAVPQPHNLFLAWWLQAGFLGLAGFLWLIINFFRRTLKILRQQKPSFVSASEGRQPLILISAVVMIYFLVHGLVDTVYWKNDLALIFWAITALSYKATRRSD